MEDLTWGRKEVVVAVDYSRNRAGLVGKLGGNGGLKGDLGQPGRTGRVGGRPWILWRGPRYDG